MTPPLVISVTPVAGLERLASTLGRLQEISGRSAESVLALKGGQMLFGNSNPKFGATFRGLYSLFRAQAPKDGAIFAAAKARGFRVGRRDTAGGIGAAALKRAETMMGGFKSILINTRADGSGLAFVRRGLRRKSRRVHFRRGRLSYAVAGDNKQIARTAGDKVVNLRAVAVYFELALRESGRGFLASAWLQKRWRKFAKEGFVPEGTPGLRPGLTKSRQFGGTDRRLVNQNSRAQIKLLGEAEFTGAQDSGNVSLRLSSFVPGTLAIGERRRLFAQVIDAVVADTERYLARKQAEALSAELGALLA